MSRMQHILQARFNHFVSFSDDKRYIMALNWQVVFRSNECRQIHYFNIHYPNLIYFI